MGIHRAKEDSYIKELAKWEARDVEIGDTIVRAIEFADGGKKNAPFAEYPKMLYRAEAADGGPRICDTKIVEHEAAERLAVGSGWSVTQEAAIERVHEQHREFARLAAERANTERWMSGKARDEAAAVDESTIQHVPSIPETPIRRRVGKEGA